MMGTQAVGRAWYRARQFGNVFRSRLSTDDEALLRTVLTPPLRRLFAGMHPVAQRHHLDVCQDLQRQGWDDPEVLTAALLHDVGKGALGPWARAVIVLAQHLTPALLRPRAIPVALRAGPLAWLALQAEHPERGAIMVARAGASARMVDLIRRMDQGGDGDPALTALRRSDDSH